MKKIIFSTMIALLLAFVGCQNEELVNENTDTGNGKKVTLTATIAGAANSRVVLNEVNEYDEEYSKDVPTINVNWEESDEKFKVYGLTESGLLNGNSPTWFKQKKKGTNQFEGTLPEPANGYLAVYGDNSESDDMAVQYSLDEQDGTLYQRNEDYSTVLMYAEFSNASPSITFQHMTAILKPTFKVDGKMDDDAINNTITKIVMGGVKTPTTALPGLEEITIAPTSPASTSPASTSPAPTLADDIYIHLLSMERYSPEHQFTFKVTDNQGKNYTGSLTIRKSIEAGKLYTATIDLAEVITYCYLPSGAIFNAALYDILDENPTVTAIEFVAGSNLEGTVVYDEDVSTSHVELNYKIVNNTLQLHTSANKFKFPENCSEMFCGYNGDETSMDQITTIQFNDCIYTSEVTNMSDMFCDCQALTTIDLSSFNTSKVTEMIGMFSGCSSLTSLDLSSFNTSNVTTMNNMFAWSSRLSSITFGDDFTTSEVTDMLAMFEECSTLTTLDLSFFNTSKVTNMARMFNGCSSLTTLNLSSFTAENMGSMYQMFDECGKLEELHLENFRPTTTNETHYYWMFNVGSELEDPKRTKIYVATPNPFENWKDATCITEGKADFIE